VNIDVNIDGLFDFVPDGRCAREHSDWHGQVLDWALYGDVYLILPPDGTDRVSIIHLS
jgi:hypothetical protein